MLHLIRFCDEINQGVFGELHYNGERLAYTVEKPWVRNIPFKSCIPDGRYKLVPFQRSNGQNVYALVNEDLKVYLTKEDMDAAGGFGRYACLIHIANTVDDVVGCIGPGKQWTWWESKGKLMVTSSSATCDLVFDTIRDNDIKHINITWKHYG